MCRNFIACISSVRFHTVFAVIGIVFFILALLLRLSSYPWSEEDSRFLLWNQDMYENGFERIRSIWLYKYHSASTLDKHELIGPFVYNVTYKLSNITEYENTIKFQRQVTYTPRNSNVLEEEVLSFSSPPQLPDHLVLHTTTIQLLFEFHGLIITNNTEETNAFRPRYKYPISDGTWTYTKDGYLAEWAVEDLHSKVHKVTFDPDSNTCIFDPTFCVTLCESTFGNYDESDAAKQSAYCNFEEYTITPGKFDDSSKLSNYMIWYLGYWTPTFSKLNYKVDLKRWESHDNIPLFAVEDTTNMLDKERDKFFRLPDPPIFFMSNVLFIISSIFLLIAAMSYLIRQWTNTSQHSNNHTI